MVSSGIILCCIVVAFTFPQAGTVQVVDQASATQTVDKTEPTTSWITDRDRNICLEGETHYVRDVLRRLVESNLQIGYQDTKIMLGECNSTTAGYATKGPWGNLFKKKRWMQTCFPGLVFWLEDPKPEDTQSFRSINKYLNTLDDMLVNYITEYYELHPDQAIQAKATVKCDE